MSSGPTTYRRLTPAPLPAVSPLVLLTLLLACADDPVRPERRSDAPRALAAVAAPPAASVSRKVQVPPDMRRSPFDVDRFLTVPPNFSVAVHARVDGARFIAVAPNGDLLVSNPGAGKVFRVRQNGGGDQVVTTFLSGLRNPHDLVFHAIGSTTYLYVAESHQIDRYVYSASGGTVGPRQVVVSGLPDASTPELRGSYGHQLKNIALDRNHKLYVSIASTCNACTSDTQSDPVRGAIYQYDASGGSRRLFARGLRNAEGLAFVPGTNTLWVVVNNRDNIAYPFNDRSGSYGRVFSGYVDNHPPEEFTRVRDGGNYGWPFCNPNPDTPARLDDMLFDRDYELNRDGRVDCARMDRISKGIQAHSAPLGLTFLQGTNLPAAYREGAAVALHGSWNRSTRTGYKIVYFPWDGGAQRPGGQIDLVAGWTDGGVWGRPVDVAVSKDGALLVSDDRSGTIYKVTYTAPEPPPPSQAVTSFTLIDADRDRPVAGYNPIASGATLNLATLPSRRLSIRANTNPSRVGSVRLGYDANAAYRTENYAPYTMAGERTSTDYLPWTPSVGSHTLTATPYTRSRARGTAGTPSTIRFTVVDRK